MRRPHAGRRGQSSYTCRGCGEEYDPRTHDIGTATQDGYCGLMCALETADTDGGRPNPDEYTAESYCPECDRHTPHISRDDGRYEKCTVCETEVRE